MSAGSIVFLVFLLIYYMVAMPMVASWWSEQRGRYRERFRHHRSPLNPIWPYPYGRGRPYEGMEDLAADALRPQDDPELEVLRRRAALAGVVVAAMMVLPVALGLLVTLTWLAISAAHP